MQVPANAEAPAACVDPQPSPPPIGFFLQGGAGNLFAMYYRPKESAAQGRDVLYIHPFAGEMAASRNVIAALARELASAGIGMLTVDLFGCGDSGGEFREARWEIWMEDIAAAFRWLREQGSERIGLCGLRLGALLTMDFAASSGESYEELVLWQPVLGGQAMLTQFLRMNLDEMVTRLNADQLVQPEYRQSLPRSETIEVAGFELSADLIRAIDQKSFAALDGMVNGPVRWIEMGQKADGSLRTESVRMIEGLRSRGIPVASHHLTGSPFWLFPHSVSAQRMAKEVATVFTAQYA